MSHARTAVAAAIVIAAISRAHVARACPRCEAGQQARSEVWDDHFGLAAIVVGRWGIHRGRADVTPRGTFPATAS